MSNAAVTTAPAAFRRSVASWVVAGAVPVNSGFGRYVDDSMRAIVAYESRTGTTELAAKLIAVEFLAAGVTTRAVPVDDVTDADVADADVVIVGTWTDGLLLVGQRPGSGKKLRKLPPLADKQTAVYCTYAVDPGRTVQKLSDICEELGGRVLGGMALHRKRVRDEAVEFANRLLGAVAPATGS
jgi:hypothetical protein